MQQSNERLRHLRKDILKMTQNEFASRIHIARSHLSNIETGRIKLTERTIIDICREFHISENWFRCGEGPPFVDIEKDERIQELAAVYAMLDEKSRNRLEGYLQRLLEEQQQS